MFRKLWQRIMSILMESPELSDGAEVLVPRFMNKHEWALNEQLRSQLRPNDDPDDTPPPKDAA
ncbi:hypothetical protein [Amycolatopsis pithecellobii]|uniref:Uncharacterized protein n=1 Tax=Amycolatopsis pithecellobii TaxID=664692 RepID=A0A6N7Z7F3_9PSEU|nr:hypothetical protein [Amycolatopsis pithecellobii]MTD57161.1 hypothetical protein [Amycolatopsis pithecellobii]